MKKSKLHVWLAVVSAGLIAAEGLMHLWQPLLPPGVFAGIATIVGICARITQTYLAAENIVAGATGEEEKTDVTHDNKL